MTRPGSEIRQECFEEVTYCAYVCLNGDFPNTHFKKLGRSRLWLCFLRLGVYRLCQTLLSLLIVLKGIIVHHRSEIVEVIFRIAWSISLTSIFEITSDEENGENAVNI